MTHLTALEIIALVVGAVGVGFAKTAIGGVSAISVALFAAVLPARESTGALLVLLIVGDVIAVGAYRRHADWPTLARLFPSVTVGVVLGVAFVAQVNDTDMRRTIGAVLIMLVAAAVVQRWRLQQNDADAVPTRGLLSRRGTSAAIGVLAGFTTMVANAGGAVMSLYLLSMGMSMMQFLGTTAWFFLILNLAKVPFSLGLDLISRDSLVLDAWLVPAVLVGAALGRLVIPHLRQERFETLVLVFIVVSSVSLLY